MIEGDNIVSAARKAIGRHDYSAVLTIFPILKHLKLTKSEFDHVLQVIRYLCIKFSVAELGSVLHCMIQLFMAGLGS